MKKFVLLVTVALITLALLFAYYNPAKLEDIWLWGIGLAGTVIGWAKEFLAFLKKNTKNIESYVRKRIPNHQQP